MKIRRLILPTLICAMAIYLLAGCIYIPTFNATVNGTNAAKSVGDEQSDRPVRTHVTRRQQVIEKLGEPQFRSLDGTQIAYTWAFRSSILVYPLCFTAVPDDDNKALVLTFDKDDVLRSYEVQNTLGGMYLLTKSIPPSDPSFSSDRPQASTAESATQPAPSPGGSTTEPCP